MSKPAATVGCHHVCPQPKHPGGPVTSGSSDVFCEGKQACRQNDQMVCKGIDTVAAGSATVYINGRQAARLGDPSAHGGRIVEAGASSVFIG